MSVPVSFPVAREVEPAAFLKISPVHNAVRTGKAVPFHTC